MTENVENLMLEILRRLQNDLADLRREVRDGFADVHIQLAAMGQQVGALTSAVYSGHSRIDDLERRVARIERRLELRDDPH
ncbi:MAG: hypothetical protein U1F76_24890 [Candidatus Competibacteraceae bacterium]